MIAAKYKPTTQKALFHKDIVNHVKKWLKNLETNAENKDDLKHVLFLHGPIGCSKTVTVECLFKSYNLINIDFNVEKQADILQCIVGFADMTLSNIDKWNNKNKKEKSNIVLVDNLELCDKGIEGFLDTIHNKMNINVPVILISNNIKYKDFFTNYPKCTILEFKKPSLLELSKFVIEINKIEKLDLSREKIKTLIEKSEFDIRQLLFLLDQWVLTHSLGANSLDTLEKFDNFMNTIHIKNRDMDLCEKMCILHDSNKKFNFEDMFILASSEPQGLSNSIYQNYIANTTLNSGDNFTKEDNRKLLNDYSEIMDTISYSNIIQNDIYENQNWSLYDDYIAHSSVIPSYYLKKNSKITKNNQSDLVLMPFKDISYNFINSYEEVKRISTINLYSKCLNNSDNKSSRVIFDSESCFIITKIFINCIKNLNNYFNKNKKGKNTTKKEKLDLCNNINESDIKSLDMLVSNIYYYKLFTIDEQDFLINLSIYKEDCSNYIKKVDLSIFKRFLNIFTIDDSHKLFKSNIEISIQYKLFKLLVENNERKMVSNKSESDVVVELSDIWNF